ncbi:hypothetical protein GCM10007937_46360 [Mesorhizobium albiziae]|nr:hypothetical protein GCM10007937_46360 [Mesorhizobium albiziae]
MVDTTRIYAWTWDARPFPAFPVNGSLWRDGTNWRLGHWLNGRLNGVACGDLINAVLAEHGLPPADVANADGTMHGYVISDPPSARAAFEPVIDLFGLAVCEAGGKLVFRSEGARQAAAVAVTELVVDGNNPAVEVVRIPDHQLPTEAVLGFRDALADYQAGSARHVKQAAWATARRRSAFLACSRPPRPRRCWMNGCGGHGRGAKAFRSRFPRPMPGSSPVPSSRSRRQAMRIFSSPKSKTG